METDDLGAALRTLMGKAKVPAPRKKAIERMYDLFHKTRSQEEQGELEGLVKEHGRPKFMSNESKMTKVQSWVDDNCRFAMDDAMGAVRMVAAKAGLRLTEAETTFLLVKVAVLASGGQDLETILNGLGINLDEVVRNSIVSAGDNVVDATSMAIRAIQESADKLKQKNPGTYVPTIQSPATYKLLNQKVRDYLRNASPAELAQIQVQRMKARPISLGPHAEEQRTSLTRPPLPQSGKPPVVKPDPYNKPIPRQPYPNPLPQR